MTNKTLNVKCKVAVEGDQLVVRSIRRNEVLFSIFRSKDVLNSLLRWAQFQYVELTNVRDGKVLDDAGNPIVIGTAVR